MTTFRLYIRGPTTPDPIWNYSKTVVGRSEQDALKDAYDSWVAENPNPKPPALDVCIWKVTPLVELDKAFAETPDADIHKLPVHALHGVSKSDAESLRKSLGIKTIGDVASHPMVRAASSGVDAGNVVVLDEMVSTYRVSQRTNFRPITLGALAGPEKSEADDLFSMIQASKDAPRATSIAVVDTSGPVAPSGKPTQDAREIYNDMLTLRSLANVVAMQRVFKDHPTKYNITDPAEASAFIQAQVVNLNDTFAEYVRKRSIVETMIDQFKNISQIEHSRHRSPINFLVNVVFWVQQSPITCTASV